MLKNIVNRDVLKNAFVCLFLWGIGFIVAFSLFQHHDSAGRLHLKQPYTLFGAKTMGLFFKIFLNNALVALLISVGGYFTGGLLAVIISFWNGVKLGLIVGEALFHLSLMYILFALIHAPLEITAFCWFGAIGLLGFQNVRRIWSEKKPTLATFPRYRDFIPPLVLLFIAAFTETSLFIFHS